MSNSSLVNYTKISPNRTSPRNHKIDRITIHHMAGNISVETCGNVFAPSSRQASSNYGIDSNGRVGMYVEEKDRSWCSSSSINDNRAITIEVADNAGAPNWGCSNAAMAKLVLLCADICRRNGISRLNYTGNTNGNMTLHKWFANTDCPGAYLESQMPKIASEVNKLLASGATSYTWNGTTASGGTSNENSGSNTNWNGVSGTFKVEVSVSDLRIRSGAGTGYSNKGYIQKGVYTITETKVNGGYTWGRLKSGAGWIALDYTKYIEQVLNGNNSNNNNTSASFKVQVNVNDLRIRSGAGTGYSNKGYIQKGVYTITETKQNNGYTWGKLKSGAGWIALDYTKRL